MISRWIRATGLLALAPAAAFAFDTVDGLRFPSSGGFPAYPSDIPTRPWNVFAYAGVMHDSNPFRVETGEESDLVARVGAGASTVTRVVGRQRVLLEGYGEYYKYDRFSEIDHFGYGLRADWLFEVGNDINGVAGYRRRHRHADLGEFRVAERAMITTDQFLVDGGYRFAPDWRIFFAVDHVKEKSEVLEPPEIERTNYISTLTYSTPLGNSIGVLGRVGRGDARTTDAGGIASIVDFDEHEIALTLAYRLGAQLRLGGRVGHTERDYESDAIQDFSGPTYRGTIDWVPTGKLTMNLTAYREPVSTLEFDATEVVRQGASVGVAFAMTFKLVFTATFINETRDYQGDPGAAALGLAQREDTLRVWRFAAGWEPLRHWQLSAGLDLGERDSNRLGETYDYTQVMLNLRWTY
jgi:Putative beta-barrel porin 2